MAILIVLVSLALLMAIVTELSVKETVKYKLALNERDALQAEALAQSGANFSQLILTVQEPIQTYLANFAKMGIQLPAYTVWDLMPIDSDLLKGITEGSYLPDFGLDGKSKNGENPRPEPKKDEKPLFAEKKVSLSGEYETPDGGYGAFVGSFSSIIEDEEKKISLRRWSKLDNPKRKLVADQIFRVLSRQEYAPLFDGTMGYNANISPSQIVGNIYDYISDEELRVDVTAPAKDWGRNLAGDKKSVYVDSPGLSPKRAPLDSMAELRFVPGMTDGIYQVLTKHLTIYGESDKINILSASDEILATVFFLCTKNKESGPFQRLGFEEQLLSEWHRKKNDGKQEISAEGIIAHLEENGVEVDKDECNKNVGTESKTFTIKSTAQVGNVTKTLLMRLRSAGGITTIYQYQYL